MVLLYAQVQSFVQPSSTLEEYTQYEQQHNIYNALHIPLGNPLYHSLYCHAIPLALSPMPPQNDPLQV